MARRYVGPKRRPKADETDWPWRDPGHKEWTPSPQADRDLSVDYYEPQVTAVLLGPDGEPLVVQTDEVAFGFARYLEERDWEEAE